MQPYLNLIQSTGGRLESQPKTMSLRHYKKLVVIYIQDHLDSEECIIMNDDLNQSESNFNSEDDTIIFPSEPQYEVSKEEIGKWVDQLMEMPEPEISYAEVTEEFSNNFDDPFTRVAERILSDETF
jgi:uncharacterized protein YaaR (DUF327 family)